MIIYNNYTITHIPLWSQFQTWWVRKENEVVLHRAEMRIVRWMCGVKVKDRVPSKELRD